MKTQKLLFFCMALFIVQFTSPVYADVTKTVGATGADYPTLTAAFSAINAGGVFDGSPVTLQIIASTTGEAATLNGPVHYSSVTIYPTVSGLSISGSGNVLTFNGATNVTIDGRVNGAGTANLIINNTSASFKVITFTNGSQYNTVRYCNIQCSIGGKAVNFTTSAIAGGNGYNTISNNVITNYNNTRPTYGIYSSGSAGYPNTGNIIRDNEFKNLMTTSGYGIYLEGAATPTSTGWSITGNSFYETSSFVPAAVSTYIFMQLGVGTGASQRTGTNFTISDNYIGGTDKNCGGTAMSKTSSFNFNLTGIQLHLADGGTNSIQNNTIKNISWTNTNNSNVIGISLGASGTNTVTNIGTVTGNSIGDNTTTGSITVTNGTTSSSSGFTGISIGTSVLGATYCQNNKIGSVTTANSTATAATPLWAIKRDAASGTTVISNNVIGSTTVSNSLNCSSTSTGAAQTVAGILSNGTGTNTIENNTIANLTNGTTSTTAGDYSAYGINCGGGGRISNNTVYNISSGSGYSTKTVVGIVITGNTSPKTVSGNTISGIYSSSASYTGFVNGIFQPSGTSDTISGNFIHSISVNGSSTGAGLCGIRFFGSKPFIKNNIVFLGGNTNSGLYGIMKASSDSSKIYHNTVYISGTPVTGANNSYGYYSTGTGIMLSNNLLVNDRSNGGSSTAKHIALHADASSGVVSTNNDLYAPNTGGYVGELGTTAYQTLSAWQTVRGAYEVNSLNIDPLFTTEGGTTATNYKTSSTVTLSGTPLAEVKTDYEGNARDNTSPRMGAYESVYVIGALLTGMTPSSYTLPTGWEVVRTQNFETGSLPSDEMGFGSITTTSPYSGNRSLQSSVWKDDCATGWKLIQGVATGDELYISWYEYMEDQGRMNDEMWLMNIRKNFTGGYQTERWQWLNDTGDWNKMFNILDGNLAFFCEGTKAIGSPGSKFNNPDDIWRSVGFGEWQQWEVYWKNNTPGSYDGLTQIYLNGVKITEIADSTFSGTLDMSGPAITLGGTTYTKIIWGPYDKPSTVCATNTGEFKFSINRPNNFAVACICPDQCPPNGYVPIFNRFIDDIIILQKEDLGTPMHLDNNKIMSVKLYPNPVGATLSVSLEQEVGGQGTIELCTLQGTILYQTSDEVSFPHQINVSSYAPGVYLVKVVSAGQKFTKKVIIN